MKVNQNQHTTNNTYKPFPEQGYSLTSTVRKICACAIALIALANPIHGVWIGDRFVHQPYIQPLSRIYTQSEINAGQPQSDRQTYLVQKTTHEITQDTDKRFNAPEKKEL